MNYIRETSDARQLTIAKTKRTKETVDTKDGIKERVTVTFVCFFLSIAVFVVNSSTFAKQLR